MVDTKPFIVLVSGFGNYKRKYPAYDEKLGKEGYAYTTYYKRFTIQEHLDEIHSIIPQDKEYLMIGYSLGASLIVEYLNKYPAENCKGVTLIGGSRIQGSHWFLNFVFKTPVPVILFFSFIMALCFPVVLIASKFNFKKAIPASFEGLYRLIENGPWDMKKAYNTCLRKVGKDVNGVLEQNKKIPVLIIKLVKDMMVNEEDLEYTKSFFNKVKERILPSDIIHLTHKDDKLFLEIVEEETEFFGY